MALMIASRTRLNPMASKPGLATGPNLIVFLVSCHVVCRNWDPFVETTTIFSVPGCGAFQ